jgi:hydroxymethylpyrimidine pyrophosphatase-like HAD family hydrolase
MHFLDIQHASISKYGALNFILTELKIHNDQALFFGDNGNDMSIMMNLKNAYIFNQFQDELSLFYGIKNKNRF